MTEDELRIFSGIHYQLNRIADALERVAPLPHRAAPGHVPADVDRLSQPSRADLAKWQREDEDERTRISL